MDFYSGGSRKHKSKGKWLWEQKKKKKKTSQHEEFRGTQGLEGNVWGRNLSRDLWMEREQGNYKYQQNINVAK